MSTRTINKKSALSVVAIVLSTMFILSFGGCASTETRPGSGPGTPDETQMQHYEMLKSAIQAKSKGDALAALAFLQADVFRWHTNVLEVALAMTDLASVTYAVDDEDWDLVNKLFRDLTLEYRGHE